MIKMLPAASTFYYFSYGIMASLGGHKKQPQLKHLFERVALSLEFVLTPPRNQQNRGGFQNCSSMILKDFRWKLHSINAIPFLTFVSLSGITFNECHLDKKKDMHFFPHLLIPR